MLVPLPEVVEKILMITQHNPLIEHCGVYTDMGEVICLRNISEKPESSYVLDPDEVVELFESRDDFQIDDLGEKVGVWHTHPSGLVGPSREDLRTKIDGLNYLVVTIPTGEAVVF
jgi:proteasome lid subunit RPN8/RPN11